MSEHELEPLATQTTLQSAVDDLDERLEALTASLESLRSAVRVVASHVRSLDDNATRISPVLSLVEAPVDAEPVNVASDVIDGVFASDSLPQEVEPVDEDILAIEAAAAALKTEPLIEKIAETPPVEAPQAAEAARDEVRKAVEATRAELSWSNLRVDSGFSFGKTEEPETETPPAPVFERPARTFGLASEPEAPAHMPDRVMPGAVDPEEEQRREEARKAVEAARAEIAAIQGMADVPAALPTEETTEIEHEPSEEDLSSFSFAPSIEMTAEVEAPAEVDPEEARREEVRRAVEAARAEASRPEAAAHDVDAEEARREEVRLAVERARAEMLNKSEPAPVDDDEARRAEVRRMVENTRGALSWNTMPADSGGSWGQFKPEPGGFNIGPDQAPARNLEPSPLPSDPEEARREEVRRAVEAARMDMTDAAAGNDGPRIVPVVPRPGSPTPKGADFNGPPVIVIEDPSGRVELAQVFATLSKVDRTAQAALLNYSPHSVTIGLGMLSPAPDVDQLRLAAQSVFGRSCSVKTEGNRTAIEVGTKPVGYP